MARKNSSAVSDEEFELTSNESGGRPRSDSESPLDARMLDLDDEAESPFLRGQKRVPVRRGTLPRKTAGRVKRVLLIALVMVAVAGVWFALQKYGTQSWRFRLDSSDNVSISGVSNVSRNQVLDVLASDIDRNIFFVPLEQRKAQLEQIPWVQSASVMRLLPNRLKIVITERVPVAFVQVNSHIQLIDPNGVIMEMPAGGTSRYSFPVIIGISDTDPLSTRVARMKIYSQLVKELDSSGASLLRRFERRGCFRPRRCESYGHRSAWRGPGALGLGEFPGAFQGLCSPRAGVAYPVPEARFGGPALRPPGDRQSGLGESGGEGNYGKATSG